ncbi:AI-2E family transporter [Candidatus Woesearchaeota archaeon]|nr:AI-2E family transporter [Candidatus Woesearchaeota archaeon]
MAKKRKTSIDKKPVVKTDFYKYFFIIIFVLLAFLSFLVVRPFINSILASMVIAYIFYLPYKWLYKKIPNKTICALIMSVIIILILLVPIGFVLKMSTEDAQYLYIRSKQRILSGDVLGVECGDGVQTRLCKTSTYLQSVLQDPDVQYYLKDILSRTTTFIINKTSEFIISLPKILLQIFITFFIVFYLLKQGPELVLKVKKLIPLSELHQGHVYKKMKDTAFAVIYGAIVIAIFQGMLGGIGFWAVGIKAPLFWGILMSIFALVPFIGTAIVWFPASILLILQGTAEGNVMLIWKGVGLMLYGAIIVGGADNLIKPKIIGTKAGMHPVLVLLGVLGGFYLFGFAGFLIGPMIIAASVSFLDLYEKEKQIV